LFISFEGIDGSGKSTLLERVARWLEGVGVSHVKTREPGGTVLGETLRQALLDPSFAGMQEWAEVLLYAASRVQHVHELIRPSLEQGFWVLSDRYADATLAYQGYGRGLDRVKLRQIHEWTTGGLWPDSTVLLDCSLSTAAARRKRRCRDTDRVEGLDELFHERVRQGYLDLAREYRDRFIVLDAALPVDELFRQLLPALEPRMGAGNA
jgi:dTMP kinase